MYSHEWTVRWGHVDMFGIAYYPRIVEAMHDTADAYMEDLGWPFWELPERHDVGLPIVEVDVEFHAPLRAGESVVIGVAPAVGERSLRYDYTGTRADGEVAFEGYEQRVCVPFEGDSSVPLPDALRAALEGDRTAESS